MRTDKMGYMYTDPYDDSTSFLCSSCHLQPASPYEEVVVSDDFAPGGDYDDHEFLVCVRCGAEVYP
jgi:hypothetical protein